MLSTGQNKYSNCHDKRSIHAEEDAISRLPNRKKNKLENVNMLVVKVKRDGSLSNSAPCVHCLKMMAEAPLQKGYKIDKVYYSTDKDEIECAKLIDLIKSDSLWVSSYYRHSGYDMEKWHKWRKKYISQ